MTVISPKGATLDPSDSQPLLDDLDHLNRLDTTGMFELLFNLPDRCGEAMLHRVDLSHQYTQVQSVVITGMGASGIGGDMLQTLLGPRIEVPIVVNKGYEMPGFVDNRTLVIAISYSGTTEETLSAASAALAHGAKVIVVTSGGRLEEMARDGGLPLIKVPPGMLARSALAYMFFPLIAILKAAGITQGIDGEGELVSLLADKRHSYKPESEQSFNLAKQLASRIHGSLPVIYGGEELSGAAAMRWKGQFNENGKMLAFANVFPEINHNETVGFSNPRDILSRVHLIFLRDKQDHPGILARMEETRSQLGSELGGITEVWAEGHSEAARLFSLIYLGDYVSLYLALANEVDPAEVERSDFMKARMIERSEIVEKGQF